MNSQNNINREAKPTATNLGIHDRATSFAKKQAFITLKHHKDNFENAPKCRLINPAKNILGHVRQADIGNHKPLNERSSMIHQWKNTMAKSVINWFKALENKQACAFIKFHIVDFYPSITEDLLK